MDNFNAKTQISFSELIFSIWSRRGFVFKILVIAVVIGAIVALTSPVEWSSRCDLLPEEGNGSSINNSLGGLAGLAGVQLPVNQESGINPELYPNIAKSTPFFLALMYESYSFDEISQELTLKDYFMGHEKTSIFSKLVGIPSSIYSFVAGDDGTKTERVSSPKIGLVELTKSEDKVLKKLRERISVTVDKKSGVVSIGSKMQDAKVSAEVTQFVSNYITEYVIEYQVSNEKRKLEFVKNQMEVKNTEFEKVQDQLSKFRDSNIGQLTSMARNQLDNLEANYNLKLDVLSSLQKEFEQSKIHLEEVTPVFKVLEPVVVPIHNSSPKKLQIVVLALFLGLFCSFFIVFVRIMIKSDPDRNY